MHPALQHHTRRGPQSAALEHGLRLRHQPDARRCRAHVAQRVLFDSRFRGMSAERIYNLLEEEEKQTFIERRKFGESGRLR